MRLRAAALVAWVLIALHGQAVAGSDAPAGYRLLVIDGHQLKWGAPQLGSRASISYAVVAGERSFPGARNCSGVGPTDAILASNRITAAAFRAELARAFAAWESIAGITFAPGDPESADILIGAQTKPRGRAFTNVNYDKAAKTQDVRSITRALICLNPIERWKIGFDGDLDAYDLRYTLMHEIGHAIGLNHPRTRGLLMHFSYGETFRTLQAGDAAGALAIYGPAARRAVAEAPTGPGPSAQARSWGEAAFDSEPPAEAGAR